MPKRPFWVLNDENQYALMLKESLFSEDKPKILKDAYKKEKKYSVLCKMDYSMQRVDIQQIHLL